MADSPKTSGTSPYYFMFGAMVVWYLAGMATIYLVFKPSQTNLTTMPATQQILHQETDWYSIKKALPWAVCGFVASFWVRQRMELAHKRYLKGLVRTANPLRAAVLEGIAYAAVLGLSVGFVLSHWYLPWIDPPVNTVVITSSTRDTIGSLLTMLGGLLASLGAGQQFLERLKCGHKNDW